MKPARRSRWFWLLLLILSWFTLTQGLRFIRALVLWNWLESLGLWPGPGYLAFTGLMFALGGGASTYGLIRRHPWGLRLGEITLVAWSLWNWSDRLWIARSPDALWNWPFALIVNLILLGLLFLATSAERKRLHESQPRL